MLNLKTSLALSTLMIFAMACGDDTPDQVDAAVGDDAGVGNDAGTNGDAGINTPPPPPALGTRIDRMGRAAVSTALIAFLEADETAKGNRKNAYNAAGPSEWASFETEIRTGLAIYDSLDTVCGNSLLADAAMNDSARYATLATVLADDRLYVSSDSGTCTQYFGVELAAVGAIPAGDCGGRAPGDKRGYDVIDITYSAVSVGAATGVGDGIDADTASHSDTAFPFLAAP